MSVLRILDAAAVRRALGMAECIDAVEHAMRALSAKAIAVPPRQFVPLKDGSGVLALMPGSALAPPTFGAKVVSLLPSNPKHGRPAVQGFIALFDHRTGAPCGIVEGAAVTAIRTAAASGLAVRLLANPSARTHGVIGSGVQAGAHVDAILAVRPEIEETLIYGRSREKANCVAAAAAARTGRKVRAVATPQEACGCDVVSAVTSASEPVVLGAWLKPGAHLNLVGSHEPNKREADTAAIARAELYVDLLESALSEAGDILIPIKEGAIVASHIRGEIGAVAAGSAPGRSEPAAITVYKSLGVAAQDLFAAWCALERAEALGVGALANW